MHRKVAGKSSDSNSSSMRSPILVGNRMLSVMLSVVYIVDVCVCFCLLFWYLFVEDKILLSKDYGIIHFFCCFLSSCLTNQVRLSRRFISNDGTQIKI